MKESAYLGFYGSDNDHGTTRIVGTASTNGSKCRQNDVQIAHTSDAFGVITLVCARFIQQF